MYQENTFEYSFWKGYVPCPVVEVIVGIPRQCYVVNDKRFRILDYELIACRNESIRKNEFEFLLLVIRVILGMSKSRECRDAGKYANPRSRSYWNRLNDILTNPKFQLSFRVFLIE